MNVPVVEGERVTKGQRLTEMDSRIAAAERDKAQAALTLRKPHGVNSRSALCWKK